MQIIILIEEKALADQLVIIRMPNFNFFDVVETVVGDILWLWFRLTVVKHRNLTKRNHGELTKHKCDCQH